jgi:hypothetical protein
LLSVPFCAFFRAPLQYSHYSTGVPIANIHTSTYWFSNESVWLTHKYALSRQPTFKHGSTVLPTYQCQPPFFLNNTKRTAAFRYLIAQFYHFTIEGTAELD